MKKICNWIKLKLQNHSRMKFSYLEEDKALKKECEDEYESDSEDKGASKKEHACMALKANTFRRSGFDYESNSYYIEVLFKLTLSEFKLCLDEIFEKSHKLQ